MSKRLVDSVIVSRNEIDGVTISSIRRRFRAEAWQDDREALAGYETCLFFPNGESHVVAMSGIEEGILLHHNNLVADIFRSPIVNLVVWLRKRYDLQPLREVANG